MMKIVDEQRYEDAVARLEELEMLVDDDTPKTSSAYKEVDALIDAIDEYESQVYPIASPTPSAASNCSTHEL